MEDAMAEGRYPCLRPPAPSGARRAGTVQDIFAGSTGAGSSVAGLICNVKSAISNQAERGASSFHFVSELPSEELATLWNLLPSDDLPVEVNRQQREMALEQKPTACAAKPNWE